MTPEFQPLDQSGVGPFAEYRFPVPNGQGILDLHRQDFLYDSAMKLNDWVSTARKHAKLTQEQLGEALGVTKANVSAWENARHEPSYGQLQIIAKKTGYPLSGTPGINKTPTPPPRPDFKARHITDSDWAMLEDIKVLPMDERDAMLTELRQRAAKYRAYMLEALARANDEQ